MKTFDIVYIPTDETIQLTLVSITSLLLNNTKNNINIHLFYDEFFDEKLLDLFKKLKKYKNLNTINTVKINSKKYLCYSKHNSYIKTYYLYEAGSHIKAEKILFLNYDTIINDDLTELFDTDLSNNSCAAVEFIDTTKTTNILRELAIPDDKLYRPTTLLINLDLWNKNFTQLKSVSMDSAVYKSNPNEYFFAKNIKDCKKLNLKYNYTEIWYAPKNIEFLSQETKDSYKNFLLHIETPTIISFAGPKPITPACKHSYLSLWWEYAEQTEIYEDIKEYRQLNKYKLSATSAQNSFNYAWLLSRIAPYIKPYWFRILVGFAISIPLGLLDGVTALALKPYMDYVVGNKTLELSFHGINISISSLQMAWILPIGIILFAAAQGVLRYLNRYLSAWVSRKITIDVRFALYNKLINMHPQFFDDNSSGIINSRYIGDPKTASASIVDNLRIITTDICGAVGLIAVMMYSSWKLAFVGVLVLCVAFVPVALIRKRIRETSNKNMVIGGKITTNMNETHSGSKIMTAYGLQDRQEKLFREQILESFKISMALTKRTAWMSPLMYQIASIGVAIVLGYGTYLINIGQMTAGAFASFITSLLLLYKPVKSLGGTLTGIQNVFVAMGRIFELFDLETSIKDCKNPTELKGLNSNITFENVYFEYVPNKPVLENINLIMPKNETLAIVGNSGGGKSTLVNLIPRFYDIKSGSIKIDGIDIKNISLKSLRENISMVFQDNFLYSGTIKENILMGKPDATPEELMNSIKAAHLQDMIQELPDGLDTVLGERGLTLSGGQRQRVAIARAMLRNAPIVILDEATSALDNESEAIVQKAMDNLMQNRTVFIIAHRLSTIKNANRIAVINEGHLVELGTHEELMNIENGQYKALYEMQFRSQEELKV
ncbi:MAG: ATP-binding cassette domain-containing protein [Candidatus Gastranaerophilales bacterium]|nr:ATP-binding cassette domain-containing protein [Candidatus Gastranaerophilales bacterium]